MDSWDIDIQLAVNHWKSTGDISPLARTLKDLFSVPLALSELRQVIDQPIDNIVDIAIWKYYGGNLTDNELLKLIERWKIPYEKRLSELYEDTE
ncbi:hypothetical protein [Deinococcus sp.]|uniref:hypothetical protein n=1 Tax=Deinococcus sp. TaxID=47478 RepID=UPI003CC56690